MTKRFVGILLICLFTLVISSKGSGDDPSCPPPDGESHIRTGIAGSVVLEPFAGYPGDTIHVTGSGWVTIFPRCEYHLLFDSVKVAQQGPDLGLFTQPNMTFSAPGWAAPGWHKVCNRLVKTVGQVPIVENCADFYLLPVQSIADAIKLLDLVDLQLPSIMPRGNATSVSAKLDVAKKMILTGNCTAAINQLQAAINALDALSGKTIADTPISESQVKTKTSILESVIFFCFQPTGPKLDVALTFDDGPVMVSPGATGDYTGAIIATLKDKRIKGTFFVEKSRIKTKGGKEQLKKAAKEGHEIAVHGIDPDKHHLSWALTKDFCKKMKEMIKEIKEITGKEPQFARPPGGEATLKKDIKRGKVTSETLGGPANTVTTLKEIVDCFKELKIIVFLGDGTTGSNSWVLDFTPTRVKGKKETVDQLIKRMLVTIEQKLDEAKKNNSKE